MNELLPKVQYFAYVEINDAPLQNLGMCYEQACAARHNLALGRGRERADIYPVLARLFAKKRG